MPGDMKKPRKKRHSSDDFTDENQRKLVEYLKPIIEEANITLKEFANAEPKISLATVGNIFNPKYGKCPTPRIMKLIAKKIALIKGEDNAESIYKDLLECDDKDIEEFPFVTYNEEMISQKAEMENAILKRLMNMPIVGKVKDGYRFDSAISINDGFVPRYDFVVDYTNANNSKITQWAFDIYYDADNLILFLIRDYFFKILSDATSNTVKYSVVTNSEDFFNTICTMRIPALNIYISAILYKNGKLKEQYIETSADQSVIEEMGLLL